MKNTIFTKSNKLESNFSMKARMIIVLMLCVQIIFGQEVMNLGNTQLITSPKVTKSQRTLSSVANLKKASTWMGMGGIVFGDTAIASPSLNIHSMSLSCDITANKAFVEINQKKYSIDLPIWQLQPIVIFANDTNNSVVTIYGDSVCPVRIHEAFLDKLLGLRLLQTDLMLAGNYLDSFDAGKIPDINGVPILANSEKSLYNENNTKFSDILKLHSLIYNVENNHYDSYIFTDYKEPFVFGIEDNKFVINGRPYYKFVRRDNTTNYEDFLKILADYQRDIEEQYKIFLDNSLYSCSSKTLLLKESKIFKEIKGINQNKNLDDDAKGQQIKTIIWNTDLDEKVSSFYKQQELFLERLNKIAEDILITNKNHFINNPKTKDIEYIATLITDRYASGNFLENYNLVCYIDAIYENNKTSNAMNKLYAAIKEYKDDMEILIVIYSRLLYNNYTAPKVIMLDELTNELKQQYELVYNTNPVVYDAAYNTAKWSAFFRYMKAHYPKNWNTFVTNVKNLKDTAPKVQTPIKVILPKKDE